MASSLNFASDTEPELLTFEDDGRTPNNTLPVLVYRGLGPAGEAGPDAFEASFAANGWPPQWRGGVFAYHHFHSNAHEALAVFSGDAELVLGGESGRPVRVAAGDVLILPAGTGHCRISASADFELTAAYPAGHGDWDICKPGETDHDRAAARVVAVPCPSADPVTGPNGALTRFWND